MHLKCQCDQCLFLRLNLKHERLGFLFISSGRLFQNCILIFENDLAGSNLGQTKLLVSNLGA